MSQIGVGWQRRLNVWQEIRILGILAHEGHTLQSRDRTHLTNLTEQENRRWESYCKPGAKCEVPYQLGHKTGYKSVNIFVCHTLKKNQQNWVRVPRPNQSAGNQDTARLAALTMITKMPEYGTKRKTTNKLDKAACQGNNWKAGCTYWPTTRWKLWSKWLNANHLVGRIWDKMSMVSSEDGDGENVSCWPSEGPSWGLSGFSIV